MPKTARFIPPLLVVFFACGGRVASQTQGGPSDSVETIQTPPELLAACNELFDAIVYFGDRCAVRWTASSYFVDPRDASFLMMERVQYVAACAAAGRFRGSGFKSEQLRACAKSTRDLVGDCASNPNLTDGCAMIRGTLRTGEPCENDYECASRLCRSQGGSCGTCAGPLQGEGEACGINNIANCEDGLACVGNPCSSKDPGCLAQRGVCRPVSSRAKEGEVCRPAGSSASVMPCAEGLVCETLDRSKSTFEVDSICKRFARLGEFPGSGTLLECAPGLIKLEGPQGFVCLPTKGKGESCVPAANVFDEQCRFPLICTDNTCQALPKVELGGACGYSVAAACKDGLVCEGTCKLAGPTCKASSSCPSGTQCTDGTCQTQRICGP